MDGGEVWEDHSPQGVWRRRLPTLAALAICATFFVSVYAGLSLSNDIVSYGDLPCDHRAVIGAAQFLKLGFLPLAFTQLEDSGIEVGLPGSFYSRHPSGGVVLLALAWKAGWSLAHARAIPLFFTTVGLFGIFLFFRVASGRPWFAVLATAFYASLSPVWLLADSYQFYSYALFAKGLGFWLLAAGTKSGGAARRRRFIGAGAVVAFAIVALGLETIPAIALMSVFAPAFLAEGPWSVRRGVMLQAVVWTGGGIVAGVVLHGLNILPLSGWQVKPVLMNYFWSLRVRSLATSRWVALQHPYPIEVLRRVSIYMPQVVVAAAIGALGLVARRIARAPAGFSGLGALLAACLLSEGLYFFVMQGHVREHPHTTLHLAVGAAALGAASLTMVVSVERAWTMVLAAIAAGAVLVAAMIAPRASLGNLVVPLPASDSLREDDVTLDGLARALPGDAVVAIVTPTGDHFSMGYVFARNRRSIIDFGPERWGRKLDTLRTLGASTTRPFYVLVSPETPVDVVAAVIRHSRTVADTGRFSLHAVANYDPAKLPVVERALDSRIVDLARLVAPDASSIARANVGYGLFGNAWQGFWMHAPPTTAGPATIVRLDVPEESRFDVSRVTTPLTYTKHAPVRQPKLEVELRVWVGADGDPPQASPRVLIAAGENAECRIDLSAPGPLRRIEAEVRLAPGETENTAASLMLHRIVCLVR
jgi:hypothetical protein